MLEGIGETRYEARHPSGENIKRVLGSRCRDAAADSLKLVGLAKRVTGDKTRSWEIYEMTKNLVMLVVNDGNDVRAHKEAVALLDGDSHVTMIGRSPANRATEKQMLDGVEIFVTPQIKTTSELRAVVANASGLSLRDKLYAYAISVLWDAAGKDFAAAPPAPKILKPESTVEDGLSFEVQRAPDKWAGRLHAVSQRADGNRMLMGRDNPGRFFRTIKWAMWSIVFRGLWTLSVMARLWTLVIGETGPRSARKALFPLGAILSRAAVGAYRVLRRLLPVRYRNRLQAKVAGMANQRRSRVNYFLYFLESRDIVRTKKPDVVHAHDLYMLEAAVKTAKENGAKAIYDAHEFERYRSHHMTEEQRKVIVAQEEKYVADVDGVITVSDTIADKMAELMKLKHIELIYNSPVTDGCRREPFRNVRAAAGLGPSTPLALFVGKVYDIHRHDHRVDHLIQALAQTSEMHLALLSITTPASQAQIRAWAEKFYVEDRIHILDPVPYKDLLSYIHAADLGIYSMPARCLNIEYSMPNKLFEYALAGVPLAVSNLTDATRFVTELGCGEAYDSWSVRATAKAMQSVYDNRERYTMDSDRLQAAQEKYGWEAQGMKLRRLYDAVLAGKRPAYRGLEHSGAPEPTAATLSDDSNNAVQAAE